MTAKLCGMARTNILDIIVRGGGMKYNPKFVRIVMAAIRSGLKPGTKEFNDRIINESRGLKI